MRRRRLMGGLFLLIVLGGGLCLADSLSFLRQSGGGAVASGGTVRLSGAISPYGLPLGYSGRSSSPSRGLAVGFYPALVGALTYRNAADPAWLKLETPAGAARSHPSPQP